MSIAAGIYKTLTGRGERKSAQVPWIMSGESVYGLWAEHAPAMSRDNAMKISTVNRCVEVLSTSMAVLPTYFTNEHTHERSPRHRLGELFWSRPNEAMTQFDFDRLQTGNEVLRGNAYAWIIRDRTSGRSRERIPLNPDLVSVMQEPTGLIWYQYADPVSGDLYRIDQEDVEHLKGYSTDGMRGIGVLKRAAMTLETAQAAEQFERSVYRNGGRPSGVLTTKADLSRTEVPVRDSAGTIVGYTSGKDAVRAEWEKVHRGPDNALRLAVLDNDLTYTPIAMSGSDMQFVENKDIRVADLCRFFGVPLHLVYAGKQSYASNEQNGIEYVNYTLLGRVRQWEQEMSWKHLLPSERAKGERIRRELKIFLQGDTAAQANWLRTQREIGGLNADEVRALDDRPRIPGGEVYTVGPNYMPILMEKRMEE